MTPLKIKMLMDLRCSVSVPDTHFQGEAQENVLMALEEQLLIIREDVSGAGQNFLTERGRIYVDEIIRRSGLVPLPQWCIPICQEEAPMIELKPKEGVTQ